MNKQIFIINGSGFSGKDTFVSLVSSFSSKEVMNVSSVDKVKQIAKMIGWDGGKTEKDRKFLSDLKVLCTEYNDMPFESMKEKAVEFFNNDAVMLFFHIREPHEIERAKKEFNAKTILIKRDSIEQITSNMADANVLNYDYDIVVYNDGDIIDYEAKAGHFYIDFLNYDLKNIY